MDAKERLYARLEGKPVDKIPNLNIVMGLAAKEAGATYEAYARDFRVLVEGNLRCAEKYGLDLLASMSDPAREATAFGARVEYRDDAPPYITDSPLFGGYDPLAMRFPDPADSPRTLNAIQSIEEYRRRAGNAYPIAGWVEGVLAETADMRGVNNLLLDLMEEPPGMRETMERIFEYACLFAKRQVEAGADFIGVGNAIASVIGPALYEKHALQDDIRLVRYIQSLGAKVKLHICGNITPLLPLLTRVAPDILDIDWMVDFGLAVRTFSGLPTSVNGNMDPVAVMLQGSVSHVEEMTRACIAAGDETTIISAGCEVPAATPPENLVAMNALLAFDKTI